MRDAVTAAEVLANFVIEDTEEAVQELVKAMSEYLDYETSGELLEAAINTVTQEEADACNMIDKLAWIARQCFLMGCAYSFRLSADAARKTYNELFLVDQDAHSTYLKSQHTA